MMMSSGEEQDDHHHLPKSPSGDTGIIGILQRKAMEKEGIIGGNRSDPPGSVLPFRSGGSSGGDNIDNTDKAFIVPSSSAKSKSKSSNKPSSSKSSPSSKMSAVVGGTTNTSKENAGGHNNNNDKDDAEDDDDDDDDGIRLSRGFTLGNFETGQVNFLEDRPAIQTYGRRIAIWLGTHYTWYNPHLKKENNKENNNDNDDDQIQPPSLERAWAFFEHVTLPRYIVEEETTSTTSTSHHQRATIEKSLFERIIYTICRGNRKLAKAEPGERDKPTKLYSVINTPMSQMADFGLGYGLYFSTLRSFAILFLCIGILQFPVLLYFNGNDYYGNQHELDDKNNSLVPDLLRGSAICINRTWVPCSDCIEKCLDCTFEVDGSYHQEFAYEKERALTFFEAVPILGNNNNNNNNTTSGALLNVTDYLVWDTLDTFVSWNEFFSQRDIIFTKEKFYDPLEEQYGIRYFDDRIEVNPPGEGGSSSNMTFILPCTKNDCIFQYTWPQLNDKNDAYIELGSNITAFLDIESPIDLFEPTFALKNNCGGVTKTQGYVSMASVVVLILGLLAIRIKQNKLTVEFDEDEQTAQDYSITIRNPPKDAYDPNEWKMYFETNFSDCKVTVCTVDVSNDEIVQCLVKRRELLRSMEILLPPNTMETPGKLEEAYEKAKMEKNKAVIKLYDQLQVATEEAKEVVQESEERDTTHVFITFETEAAQRQVLSKLTVGATAIHSNKKDTFDDPKYLFRGNLVLDVVEPEEPSTIRWQELDSSTTEIVLRLIMTSILTAIVLGICWVIVLMVYLLQPSIASYVLTVFTIAFPMAAKALMDMEVHRSESTRQSWLFVKIGVFNICITSLLIGVFTPFHSSLDEKAGSVLGLVPAIHALFFSQLGVTPILQLADIGANVGRHFFAPRAKTQEEMNMNMRGTEVYLAERYGNMMKFIYLMVWYCVVYPQAFFMGSFALFIAYFVDRFSLMRSWSRPVQLGTQISDVSRNFFAPLAVVIMVIGSAYLMAGFPFDHLCIDDETVLDPYFIGNRSRLINGTKVAVYGFTLYETKDEIAEITVEPDSPVYKYCNMDMRQYTDTRSFPPLPKFQIDEWMTPDQEQVVTVYSWLGVVVLGAVLLRWMGMLWTAFHDRYSGTYEPQGEDMGIPFSKVDAIDSYLPQVTSSVFAYPLLLGNVDNIDASLFNWTDPEKPHSHYDITQDAKELAGGKHIPAHLFSRVQYWPPDQ